MISDDRDCFVTLKEKNLFLNRRLSDRKAKRQSGMLFKYTLIRSTLVGQFGGRDWHVIRLLLQSSNYMRMWMSTYDQARELRHPKKSSQDRSNIKIKWGNIEMLWHSGSILSDMVACPCGSSGGSALWLARM